MDPLKRSVILPARPLACVALVPLIVPSWVVAAPAADLDLPAVPVGLDAYRQWDR